MKIDWKSRKTRTTLGIAGAVGYPLAANAVLELLAVPTYGSYTCRNTDGGPLHPAYGGNFWLLSLLWLAPGIAAFLWMLHPLKWHWTKTVAMTALYVIALFLGVLTVPEIYSQYVAQHTKAGCPQPLNPNVPWDYE